MRIDGPQITGSFSIGNTTFPDVSTLATTGSNTFVGNQVISGSIVSTQTTLISGSSQVLSGTGIFSGSAQLPSGIISGSSQLPTGIVSSSAQVIAYGVSTTGSNILQGNQTITGSLFISENLVVAGSSSIQHISSSVVNINDNIITVNALNPSVRFGGLAVIDSGSSPQVSGSMLFDSINNQWLFVHQNQGTVTSSVLLMGPETYNNLGNESYITTNRLVKSTGIEHLSDSNITDTGTKVSINSSTEVTGSLITTGNVGIGSNSPVKTLEVRGTFAISNSASSYWYMDRDDSDGRFKILTDTDNERFSIATGGAATFSSSVSALSLDVISASGVGSSTASGLARFITAGSTTGISVGQSNSSRRLDISSYNIAVTGEGLYLATLSNHPIYFSTNSVDKMIITAAGNVGIGTASPNANLDIQRVAGDSSDILRLGSNQNYYFGFSRNTSNGALQIQGNQTGYNNISLAPTSGNVGIGTASPNIIGFSGPILTIAGTGQGQGIEIWRNSNSIPDNEDLGVITFLGGTSPSQLARIVGKAVGTNEDAGALSFQTCSSGGGVTERMRITSDAYLRMSSGTGGIQFNGDTAAANALDDYEEGSFTPSSLGTDFSSISVTFGRYIKIGNQVTINCRWAVTPGSTGMKYVVFDLPFAFVNNSNVSFTGAVSNYNEGQTAGSSNVGTTTRNSSGSTTQQYVQAYYTSTNVSTLLLSMTYFTFY